MLIAILLPCLAHAQSNAPIEGVKYGLLPILSFNTDDGMLIGGEIHRYNYGGHVPFANYMKTNFMFTTAGVYNFSFSRDQVKTFNTDIRTGFDVFSSQNFGNYYLGDTDKNSFDRPRFDSTSYYKFKSFTMNVGISTRWPISFGKGIERMDIKTGIRFVYEGPWGTPEERFINEKNITGNDGSFLTILELAFILERRNSEFRAQKGYLLDAGFKYAPPLVSTEHTLQNYINAVGFLPVLEVVSVTLAGHFNFQNTIGDAPYWFKPYLGDATRLRGFMYRRFSSDNIISYNLEIRTWLVKIPFKNIELGANFFYDGGKAFSNDNWSHIIKGHKHTLGFGGVMSIFTPDYILKYDIGFSDDGLGIYLGTGYSF